MSLTTLNAYQQGGPVLDKLKQLWGGIRGKADDPSLGYVGASMLPGIGEATDLVEIGAGLQDRSPGRVGLGLAALMLPFVGAPAIRKFLKGLPMDEASRLKRAEDMGFDLDLYHGTDVPMRPGEEWTSLEPGTKGALGPGVYLADPDYASYPYARTDQPVGPGVSQPRLYPVKVRSKKLLEVGSDEYHELLKHQAARPGLGYENETWSSMLRGQGYEGMYAPESIGLRPQTVIFDPKNIRSRWAAFDPAKAGSRDLLAGIGGLASARYMSNALREDREN